MLAKVHLAQRDGVAQRRPANCVGGADPGVEHVRVAGKFDVDARPVVEVEHEDLVLRIRRAHERERRCLGFRAKPPHAAAVVDEQPERHRYVVSPKHLNRLADAVFVNGKGVALERSHWLAAAVFDRRLQDDEARFSAECGRRLRHRIELERCCA
jgi:hypothetical protein